MEETAEFVSETAQAIMIRIRPEDKVKVRAKIIASVRDVLSFD
jgi:hypothetical protein